MSELTVSARYAKSLIDLAGEQKLVEDVKNDMEFFRKTLKANPELTAVLGNPIVSHLKKVKILDKVFLNKVTSLSIVFFKLMIDKGRGEVLYFTAQEYIHLYDIINNIVEATVVSAVELSEDNKKQMIADIEKATGSSIKLKTKVDPSLIGGFVLTVGDRQVDTSISADLKQMKKDFTLKVNAN